MKSFSGALEVTNKYITENMYYENSSMYIIYLKADCSNSKKKCKSFWDYCNKHTS